MSNKFNKNQEKRYLKVRKRIKQKRREFKENDIISLRFKEILEKNHGQ